MTREELHRTVVHGFQQVDERFATVVDGFKQVDERFAGVDGEVRKIREEMRQFRTAIEARIQEEGETTRRHFNVMVEKVEAAVRIVAEGHGHLRTVVDNHEVRLQAIEKRV